MDKQSQERFDELVKKDTPALTPEEKEFLFARRGYLNKAQRAQFADLIKEGDEKVKQRQAETVEA